MSSSVLDAPLSPPRPAVAVGLVKTAPQQPAAGLSVRVISTLADYLELTKPRIAALVLVTVAVSAVVAAGGRVPVWRLVHTLWGTACVAASASALNQWWERRLDARMPRTQRRPLASGRLPAHHALAAGVAAILLGAAWLAWFVNPATAAWGLATWALYVCVYTPLKTRTPQNTAVGAVAGALPVLIGFSAMYAPLDLWAAALFMVLYLWQFPHFMAIAWLYRDDYAAAGMQMWTVVDASGQRAARQALLAAAALLPVSLLPALMDWVGPLYGVGACLLGSVYAAASARFAARRDDARARTLLWVSLAYLPLLLTLLLLFPVRH